MKKEEAKIISKTNAKVVIEYILQILLNDINVIGKMNFTSTKINNQNMCVLDIYVPKSNFEQHINLGVTTDHCDNLYEEIFKCLLEEFLTHETLGVGYYTRINYMMGSAFTGVTASNSLTGNKIGINFIFKGNKFYDIVNDYNNKINNYVEKRKDQYNQNIYSIDNIDESTIQRKK